MDNFDFSFNQKIKWITHDTWHQYLLHSYWPYARQQCLINNNVSINQYQYCFSPLNCNIDKTNFRSSGIREIHEGLRILIAEYSTSSNHLANLNLCQDVLSNIYATMHSPDNDQTEQSEYDANNYVVNNDDSKVNACVINAFVEGKMTFAVRQIQTFNICRGSVDDCPIKTGDWIWCFKRLLIDMTQKFHVVIRVVKVEFLFGGSI